MPLETVKQLPEPTVKHDPEPYTPETPANGSHSPSAPRAVVDEHADKGHGSVSRSPERANTRQWVALLSPFAVTFTGYLARMYPFMPSPGVQARRPSPPNGHKTSSPTCRTIGKVMTPST